MTAESTVTMTAQCDRDGCDADALWTGAIHEGGRTVWRITCPCDTASSDNKGETR